MGRIAILYICTGKYNVFWRGFYDSSEKYLFIDHQKSYFVFTDTDSNDEIFQNCQNTKVIFQEKLGWPYDTLMRFKMFFGQSDQLSNYDYIYFFNANMRPVNYISQDLLPARGSEALVGVLHPGYYLDSNLFYPYDRNKKSLAYIPYCKGKYYFMGGLNGGSAKEYLELIKTLNENIDIDLNNKVIARWHDESHINKYFLNKKISIKGPEYGFPEGSMIQVNPKIVILDKKKWGGHDYLREEEIEKTFSSKSNQASYMKKSLSKYIKNIVKIKSILKVKRYVINVTRKMFRFLIKCYSTNNFT